MEVSAAAKWSSLECSREDDNNYLVENEAQMTAAGSFSTEVPDASMSFDDKIVEEEICEDEECSDQGDRTTPWQTYIHLVKGYVGPGCLSLPWAFSQLGVPLGVAATIALSILTSYNCWAVVRIKREHVGSSRSVTYPVSFPLPVE